MAPTGLPHQQRPSRRWWTRRFGTIVFGSFLVLFIALQVVPYGRDHTNPPVRAEPAWDSPQTRAMFLRACADCHNNQTTWPWYSNVAPVSWLVMRDVVAGRAELNVSAWGSAQDEGDEAAETVQEGKMPLWFYVPLLGWPAC